MLNVVLHLRVINNQKHACCIAEISRCVFVCLPGNVACQKRVKNTASGTSISRVSGGQLGMMPDGM